MAAKHMERCSYYFISQRNEAPNYNEIPLPSHRNSYNKWKISSVDKELEKLKFTYY